MTPDDARARIAKLAGDINVRYSFDRDDTEWRELVSPRVYQALLAEQIVADLLSQSDPALAPAQTYVRALNAALVDYTQPEGGMS